VASWITVASWVTVAPAAGWSAPGPPRDRAPRSTSRS